MNTCDSPTESKKKKNYEIQKVNLKRKNGRKTEKID